MDLRHLDDETLIRDTEKLVKSEKEILTAILHHLKENERRRLFSALKFESIYDYCIRGLGYTENEAYPRIQSMRLLRELPEIEEKINSGDLSLTNLSLAQKFFKREVKAARSSPNQEKRPLSKEEKLKVLSKMENKTKREAEKIIFSLSPEIPTVPDKIRDISEDKIEIKFTAKKTLGDKIQKLKGLMAHTSPNATLEELFEALCDAQIAKLTAVPERKIFKTSHTSNISNATRPPKASKASIYREVKNQGYCENCGSLYGLEVDHIQPRTYGGDSSRSNLRLLCRSCNQRAAIEKFGVGKMETYLSGT